MSAKYAVTDLAHPQLPNGDDCDECLDLAKEAAINARVTGSRTASHTSGSHFGTVRRITHVITL